MTECCRKGVGPAVLVPSFLTGALMTLGKVLVSLRDHRT